MSEVAYSIYLNPEYNVEIILHVCETLGEAGRSDLVNVLERLDDIKSAELCPLRYHLMLVNYDSGTLNSQAVLRHVESQNIHAELIGPICCMPAPWLQLIYTRLFTLMFHHIVDI
jgi:hypothetical protein